MDTEELALYLACTMKPDDIAKEGLPDLVHTRRFKMGTKPWLTCKAITGGPVTRYEDQSWISPVRRPDHRQNMRMVGCLVKSATRLVMKNHFNSYDNLIRNNKNVDLLETRQLNEWGSSL